MDAIKRQTTEANLGDIMVSEAAKSDLGEVCFVWEGSNGTFWAIVSYWVGTGYQRVDRQISKEFYKEWNLK